MGEVRWERMFPDQLEEAFAACPLVYFAYGLCEPHGPQNVVGLDGLKAHGVACRAARAHGGIVAPPDFWHVHEIGGYAVWGRRAVGEVERRWMTAVPPWIHFKNICYQIRAAEEVGFHAAILVTGHYGPNWQDLKTLLERIQPYVAVRLYGLPDFEANQPGFAGIGDGGDHAGKIETSLLWALDPAGVDLSRIPPEVREQKGAGAAPPFAMGRDAARADRRIGERMVADEVRWLGEKGRELLAAWQPRERGLRRFRDVEDFWRREMEPTLSDLRSMQQRFTDEPDLPEDSVWHANWKP